MSFIQRSYYYDHWTTQKPYEPSLPPVRRRRRPRAGLFFVCALILIGIFTALILITGQFVAAELPDLPGMPGLTDLPQFGDEIFPGSDAEPEQEQSPTTVERAETGDGTTLTITPAHGDPLSFQEIYRRNIPSIVSIRGTGSAAVSLGTGVILSDDGYIITNAHVIEGCFRVDILLQDDSSYQALLVGMDSENDLAVLKIEAQDLTPAQFGDPDLLEVGDTALAIGNPLGEELRGTMTDGIISAINRDVNVDGHNMVLIQTTAALNSGNSGGALINEYGQVVGITTLKMSSYADTIEGLGFAIPTTTVKSVVDQLIETGYIPGRPTIGITVNTIPTTVEDGTPGLQVIEVERSSDAWHSGLRSGDIIVEANGTTIASMADLEDVKAGLEVGDTISLRIFRMDRYQVIEVTLVEQYTLDS